MSKTALITGATSGIGMATARLFAENGIRIVACGRRKERLEEIKKELGSKTEITTLCFDVRSSKEVSDAIQSLPNNFKQIDILINNAGNAHGLSLIHEGDIADWDAMIDINLKGLLYVSREIMPQMVQRKSGHIINIGSLAGKEVYPNGNIYCSTKFAVDAITESMRKDLNPYNIKISGIHPGLAETEFSIVRFKGDTERAAKVYQGFQPLVAEDIAEIIYFVITRPAHVNIADLLVLPAAQASATIVNRQV